MNKLHSREVREGVSLLSFIFILTTYGLSLLLTGCVKRTIVVESNPPGAQLWINGHPIGRTPVIYPFITHGRYKFRLEKAGFQELITREMVWAPIYEWIPLDFFFENLFPFHLEDRHPFRYTLITQSPEEHLKMGAPVDVETIVVQLKDRDWKKRRAACVALAMKRDPTTAGLALQALEDRQPPVRATALTAIRSIEGPKALDRLLTSLHSDPNREVRWQAAVELEILKEHKAVPGLIKALRDRDPLVRTGAAEALKSIPDRSALKPLIRALRDRDPAVRRAATEGLGRLNDRAAEPALTRVLFHHDVHMRRKAAEGLARLKDPASGPALVRTFTDWDPKVRRIATSALIEFGDGRVVPTLIRRLKGFRPWTREHAAQVLGGLKDPRAIEPLRRALRRETDPPAYEAMREALKALGAKPDASWERVFPKKVENVAGTSGQQRSTAGPSKRLFKTQ